ncbi:hypothetical protein BDR07DRAFT_1461601 [Suillus spraguei]|nr:hypothetical protein BDR07DRAFT_1461601 [Suillus spraguei]
MYGSNSRCSIQHLLQIRTLISGQQVVKVKLQPNNDGSPSARDWRNLELFAVGSSADFCPRPSTYCQQLPLAEWQTSAHNATRLPVVDTCLDTEDLKALCDALVVSLSLIPPYALVGLVTFGSVMQVRKLGHAECSKSYVFCGGKEYTQKQIQDMLELSTTTHAAPRAGQLIPQQAFGAARFLLPVQQCKFRLTGILEALARDPWPVAHDKRALRCIGVAVSVAIGPLEVYTAIVGPGMVVGNELKEPIRSHRNIERDSAKHYKRALKFYEGPARRASNNGHTVDLFAGCLDQVGLLEMKSLPNSTNGVIVLSDSFATSIFKQSFLRMFKKDDQDLLQMDFNAMFDIQAKPKVSGLIGHAISTGKKSAYVSETEIVIGQTSAWRINSITPKTSAAIYFEVVTSAGRPLSHGSRGLIQFVTYYQYSSGQMRLHVTTIAQNLAKRTLLALLRPSTKKPLPLEREGEAHFGLPEIPKHPIISSLVNYVNALLSKDSQTEEYDPIVPLQLTGNKTPIFFMHPGVGEGTEAGVPAITPANIDSNINDPSGTFIEIIIHPANVLSLCQVNLGSNRYEGPQCPRA